MREYIELRDKDGKALFEGDVFISQTGNKFVVVWNTEEEAWGGMQSSDGMNPDLTGEWCFLTDAMMSMIKKLGSIYDNPKLMN